MAPSRRLSSWNRWSLTAALIIGLGACTSSPAREPADASDVVNEPRDAASLDAQEGTRMDARTNGTDAQSPASDAQPTPEDAAGAEAEASVPDASTPRELESFVYVGGWGNGNYPVRTFALDRQSGALNELNSSTAFGNQPSFITPSFDGSRLYMTNEGGEAGITIASVDPGTGLPSKLDKRVYTGGGAFVFAAFDPSGKYLFAADYNGGRLASYPVMGDGKLGPAIDTIPFDKIDGNSAQTHSVAIHPSGRWVYAANKARNEVAQFQLNTANGKLTAHGVAASSQQGPRVIALTPSGQYAYVMHENSSMLVAFRVNEDGTLTEIDSKLAQPANTAKKWGAHALVHPNGKYVYTSDRGSNTVGVFAIGNDGKLTMLGTTSTEGKTPRCFDIDDSGEWLVVANQDSDSLVTFAIGSDGKLTKKAGPITGIPDPTAVAIVSRPR